jgi:hypothetical protein
MSGICSQSIDLLLRLSDADSLVRAQIALDPVRRGDVADDVKQQ